MASLYAGPVQDVIDELGRLPGIGPKSAQRIAFYLLRVSKQEANRLARSIVELKERIAFCRTCFNIAEGDRCALCADDRRDATTLCVVEEPPDIVAIERTGEFRGRYHVLHGALSPLDGVGPADLKIRELLLRLEQAPAEEVVVATNPDVEGEATALYLQKLLKPLGLKVTRIAQGVPMGGDLEFADQATLARAMAGRREL